MGDDSLCRHNHSPVQVVLFLVHQCCRTFGEAALQVVHDPAQSLIESHGVVSDAGTGGHAHIVVIHAGLGILSGIHAVLGLVHLIVQGDARTVLPLPVDLFQQLLGFLRNLHLAERCHFCELHFILNPRNVPLRIGINTAADAGQRTHNGVAVQKNFLCQQHTLKEFCPDIDNWLSVELIINIQQAAEAFRIHDLRSSEQVIMKARIPGIHGVPVDSVSLPLYRREVLIESDNGSFHVTSP